MNAMIKISAAQHPCGQQRQINLQLSIALIHQAADAQADLLVLPELHAGPYFCQTEDTNNFELAEAIPGATTETLAAVAKQRQIVIVASLFEKRAPGIYHNTAVVLDKDGSIAGIYRKMHIPDDPGYYEKFYFSPGDLGFQPISTSIGKLGVLICWDQWFPEAARLMALAGAEILIYPTAIGWDPNDSAAQQTRELQAWITVQRAHAIANGMPVLACNRIGFEPAPDGKNGILFWGNSFITGPQGEIIKAADQSETALLCCEIEKSQSEKTRRNWPYFRDRRIDKYKDLLRRYID